jgi:hypothetical protein
MIWKSTWSSHAPAPVAGYSIIGFFGPVVSLIISIGMANVAGATKKSFMAAAIFVAYCVGNIIGPQLIITPTVKQHYPELWLGLIIWCVLPPLDAPACPPLPFSPYTPAVLPIFTVTKSMSATATASSSSSHASSSSCCAAKTQDETPCPWMKTSGIEWLSSI